MSRRTLLYVALIGCGDPSPVAEIDAPVVVDTVVVDTRACPASGSGVATGTVGGAQVAPVVLAKQKTFGSAAIVIAEFAGGQDLCEASGPPLPNAGDFLKLYPCTGPGTYPIAGQPNCPNQATAEFYVADLTTTVHRALGGTLVIESTNAECVQGTFDITFDTNERVTGSFNAFVCP